MKTNISPKLYDLLQTAVKQNASDLFLVPGEPPALRLNGLIERTDANPLSAEEIEGIAAAALGSDEIKRIGAEVGQIHRAIRVSGMPSMRLCVARATGCYTIVANIMMSGIYSVEELAIPKAMIQATMARWGLIVFSGLAGSGKSTSAYALVDYINSQNACHISTIEDPISVEIPSKKAIVQQRELGVDVPDIASGVHAAMGQDLDVLFINEVYSAEDLQACLAPAETGHLVITVLHSAASPEETIRRMIDVFPEEARDVSRRTLANVLRGVSAQRLLPHVKGGRVAAYGVLIPDDEMRTAIAQGRDFMKRETPFPDGCQTIAEEVEKFRRDGIVSEETAQRALSAFWSGRL